MYGIVIDLGTTNIAASLLDLKRRIVLSTHSIKNSQKRFGSDVIARLRYASTKNAGNILHTLAINDINKIIDRFKAKPIKQVYVVGNTVMLHFLFNLNIMGLLSYPYKSAISTYFKAKSSDIGINIKSDPIIESLPVISAYLGADLVSGLIDVNMIRSTKNSVFIDMGTNAEIAVSSNNGIYAASAAAGPAFKSRLIPLGSKLIRSIAEFLRTGKIDPSGRIRKDIGLHQEDVRSLQVAKAAIYAAIEVLIKRSKIERNKIKNVYISGIFGEKIKIKDALRIKLIPEFPYAKVRFVGDAALNGAAKLMLAGKRPKSLLKSVRKIKKVELNSEKAFQALFIDAMRF